MDIRNYEKLDENERKAIEVLMGYGWQIVSTPHLEDWGEGLSVVNGTGTAVEIEIRADLAIIKVDV